jgi:hypothetical protein
VLAIAVELLLTALRHGKASGDDQANDVGTGLGKRTAPASASSLPPVYGSVQLHLLGVPVNLLGARSAWRKVSDDDRARCIDIVQGESTVRLCDMQLAVAHWWHTKA